MSRDINLSNQERIDILKGDLTSTDRFYQDMIFEKLGTNRKSEVIAEIGDTNIPYKQLVNDYLNSL